MPRQIKSNREVQDENKIKACLRIGSALVDLTIFQLVIVKYINEKDVLKNKITLLKILIIYCGNWPTKKTKCK